MRKIKLSLLIMLLVSLCFVAISVSVNGSTFIAFVFETGSVDKLNQAFDELDAVLSFYNRLKQLENKIDKYESGRVVVGVYSGSGRKIWEREEGLDVKFNHILLFQDVKNLDYSKVVPYLDKGYDVILNIEFRDSYANLKDVAAGVYDEYLVKLAEDIKKDGRIIWIRPLHEFNGDWYNWAVLYPGNQKEDFTPAWRHVVQVFRSQNAPVKLQLNYNRYNGKNDKTPFSEFWPGDEWVDMVVITSYNRAYTDEWHQFWRSFSEDFDNAYKQITALTEKPIGVAEMSTTSYGGDKPQWIIDAFNSIAYEYPRVQQVTWFLHNVYKEDMIWDWDLNTEEDKDAFKQGMDKLTLVPCDLVVSEVELPYAEAVLYANITYDIGVNVTNLGIGSATTFDVSLELFWVEDGIVEYYQEETVAGLGPGESTVVLFSVEITHAGDCELTATADCNDDVDESGEVNNSLVMTIDGRLTGDLDGDGDVDFDDIVAIAMAYGSSYGDPNYNEQADLDADGDVDFDDIVEAAMNYGKSCGT